MRIVKFSSSLLEVPTSGISVLGLRLAFFGDPHVPLKHRLKFVEVLRLPFEGVRGYYGSTTCSCEGYRLVFEFYS